jgi:copper chaperone CopZ
MNDLTKLFFGLALTVGLVLPSSAHAQLQSVKQTVFGMDCAPCAYGLENQMKSFEGVTSVSVSLNDGLATLQFAPENNLRLEKLRTAIEESGFSARGAQVEVAGTLRNEDDRWTLVTPSGERFVLDTTEKPESLTTDARAVVTGTVPKESAASGHGWTLRVKSVRAAT